ncbi:MAG TPA: hypothetical protein VGJ46_04580 [Candidatus Limnocylindrales bacterium]
MSLSAALPLLAPLLLLVALALPGIAALVRLAPFLTPLERFAHGAVLGIVAGTLAMLPLGILVGFSAPVLVVLAVASVVVAAWLLRPTGALGAFRRPPGELLAAFSDRVDIVGFAIIGLFTVRWVALWTSAMTFDASGLWAGHEYLWSDWPTHLGIVSSFAYGDNFPPQHTLYAGLPMSYHFLSDLTPAAMVVLGMDPAGALSLHSFVLSVLLALSLYAFARRMAGGDRGIASLALVLFLLGGSLIWIATLGTINESHDLIGTLTTTPFDRAAQDSLHIQFLNPYIAFVMSQRAYLYGLPLVMLSLTLLLMAARRADTLRRATAAARRARRYGSLGLFVLAGVMAGFLPLSHLPTLLTLAMVTPILVFALAPRPWALDSIPWLGWIAFHVTWVLVALPQLALQLRGGSSALSAIRIELGWMPAAPGSPVPDEWWWFWLKNLGLFAPFLVLALIGWRLLPPRPFRLLLAFMPLFAIVNVVVFQPWDRDNNKILVYWFLAVAILVAALVVQTWRRHRSATVRFLLAGAVATMVAGPILENLAQWEGQGRFQMLTTEQIQLDAQIRSKTDPHALFLSSAGHHDPLMMLAGRRLFMGYWGQLWVSGIPYQQRQAEVKDLLQFRSGTEARLTQEKIDYVVISTIDVTDPDTLANLDAYEGRYPAIIKTTHYQVFAVSPGAIDAAG